MNVKDSFGAFANRVMHAVRMGRLPDGDAKRVERLLVRTEKRNLILSRAILATLSGGEQSEGDVKKFAHLLDLANRRIAEEKEPFTGPEKQDLEELFKRHSLSAKAARKFAVGLDELLAMELKTQMEKGVVVPKKEEARTEKHEEREKLAH
jgi:hypothetical protein